MSKTVLITGAASGIGLATTKEFLNKGWKVYAHYNKSATYLLRLKSKYGGRRIQLTKANFHIDEELDEFLSQIKKLKLDAIVNNAGVYDVSYKSKDRVQASLEVMKINTIVPTLIIESAIKKMKAKKQGSIVNVSSIGAKYGSGTKNIFYAASKRGLEAVSKSYAREGASYNVLVNTIRPGVTDTEFIRKTSKNLKGRKKLIPLKRMAQPKEIALEIYKLCAENTFMTNEIITIAGGE